MSYSWYVMLLYGITVLCNVDEIIFGITEYM